jgi:hypothetical protein
VEGYAGFIPQKGWRPQVIDSPVTPAQFFVRFIGRREPVIIQMSCDPEIRAVSEAWRTIPDCELFVEHVDAGRRTFGTGVKSKSALSKLMNAFERGDDGLYVTTQPLPENSDGLPTALYASPVTEMASHTPMRPLLMGHLVPSTVNVWIGASRDGSSSNLHHDFHDNLYALLRGRKRFTIAPPASAKGMYPWGRISRVHPNGLINYGSNLTRGDGSLLPHVVRYLEAQQRRAVSEQDRSVLSSQLQAARLLAQEHQDAARGLECDDEDDEIANPEVVADDMWAALERSAPRPASTTKSRATGALKFGAKIGGDPQKVPAPLSKSKSKGSQPAAAVALPPDHFSRIDLPGLRARALHGSAASVSLRDYSSVAQRTPEVAAHWPLFASTPLTTFDLEQGQMLYLPAGWWHEVVSFASDVGRDPVGLDRGSDAHPAAGAGESCHPTSAVGEKRRRGSAAEQKSAGAEVSKGTPAAGSEVVTLPPGVHVALNWWLHPPTTCDFKNPYPDGFWEHIFATEVAKPRSP